MNSGRLENMTREEVLEIKQDETLRPFCCDCVEIVLSAFEKRFPEDDRVHRLISLNRQYGKREISYAPIEELRKELWEFWQVLGAIDQNCHRFRASDALEVIGMALAASAKPITQDNAHHVLTEQTWLVCRGAEFEKEISWLKNFARWKKAERSEIEAHARESLKERMRDWQMKRLTAYFTGKEETLMKKDPPREFVPVTALFGINDDYLEQSEQKKRTKALAEELELDITDFIL